MIPFHATRYNAVCVELVLAVGFRVLTLSVPCRSSQVPLLLVSVVVIPVTVGTTTVVVYLQKVISELKFLLN